MIHTLEKQHGKDTLLQYELEQLERLRSEDTPPPPPPSWLPTLLSHIGSKVKMKAEKLEKFAKN